MVLAINDIACANLLKYFYILIQVLKPIVELHHLKKK
jgi:hypothetical protein